MSFDEGRGRSKRPGSPAVRPGEVGPVRRRRCVCAALIACLLLSSCATLLYPERSGQKRGDFDPTAVAMDALMLLFFFVPGIVAFGVDFATGAIYLPADPEGGEDPATSTTSDSDDSAARVPAWTTTERLAFS